MPLLATGRALLPEVKAAAPGRADIAGAALWLAAVLAAVYGIKELARGGSGWIAAVPAAAVLGAAFMRRQRTAAAPLIDLRMFRRRVFRVSLAGHVLGIGVVWGMYVLIAQHLELGLGWSPLRAGTCLLAPSAGFTIGSLLLPAFTRRFHPFLVVAGGLLLGAAGLLVLAQSTGLVGFVIGSLGYSLGFAPVAPLCSTVTVESVGAEGAGIAAAIAETGSELGGALGVALLGSLATAVDRSCLAGHAFSVAAAAGAAVAVATAVLLVAPRSREAGCPAPSGREASPLATV
jgi:DHA2 family multidrug resistance protein-like MFS transporter